jgi:pSer/pThr/pTyr-binding forkhead associated (FHA) protein
VTQIVLEWHNGSLRRLQKVNSLQTLTIGRHPGCDIVLGDPTVSRRHATITFDGDTFQLQNCSQTNPIVFNDRWRLSHDVKADLQPGDTFTIGKVRLQVTLPFISEDGGNGYGAAEVLQCPTCGRLMPNRGSTCPHCRISIAELETMLVALEV